MGRSYSSDQTDKYRWSSGHKDWYFSVVWHYCYIKRYFCHIGNHLRRVSVRVPLIKVLQPYPCTCLHFFPTTSVGGGRWGWTEVGLVEYGTNQNICISMCKPKLSPKILVLLQIFITNIFIFKDRKIFIFSVWDMSASLEVGDTFTT